MQLLDKRVAPCNLNVADTVLGKKDNQDDIGQQKIGSLLNLAFYNSGQRGSLVPWQSVAMIKKCSKWLEGR